jgi:molybdopterin-guanine dinucleotide biosynthesis protein A
VAVFAATFPGGPIQLLGEGLPDRPELEPVPDPRQGPAVALSHWAGLARSHPRRWWIVACDQVRWTPEALGAWHQAAVAADPCAEHWVLARSQGWIQPLGGFLADRLVAGLAGIRAASLMAMAEALPCRILPSEGEEWLDVDTRAAHEAFLKSQFKA